MKSCVFSGSTENLNTTMTITLDDGSRVEVWISDEYADEATPKAVKQAYLDSIKDKENKTKELIEHAKSLGFDLTPEVLQALSVQKSGEKITSNQPNQPKAVETNDAPTKPKIKADKIEPAPGRRVVSGAEADKPLNVSVDTSGASVGIGHEYEIRSVDKPSEDLREGEEAEVEIIEGRSGIPIAIPTRRSGKMGTTDIRIVKGYDNNKLQADFKNLAESDVSFKDNYRVRFVSCGLCNRTGKVRGNRTCPKCGGAGEMQINQ